MPLYRFVQNLYYMLKTILYIGAGMYHNGGAKARFVGKYAALKAPCDGLFD